jgi:hypothetical protein
MSFSGSTSLVGVEWVDRSPLDVPDRLRFCGVLGSVLGKRGAEGDCSI